MNDNRAAKIFVAVMAEGADVAGLLAATLKSLSAQTYQDFGHCVYCDAKPDAPKSGAYQITLKAGETLVPNALHDLVHCNKWAAPEPVQVPRYGVVIPAYNSSAYVGAAVRSALAQVGVGPVAVVVVDDGSTDGTRRQARRAMRGNVLGQVLRQANKGVSAARNAGLMALPPSVHSVSFLDADDQLMPDALAVLHDCLEGSPRSPMAAGLTLICDADGKLLPRPDWLVKTLPATLGPESFAREWPLVTPGTQLWRRGELEDMGGFPPTITGDSGEDLRGEDILVCAMAARKYGPIACISVPVMIKREHSESYCLSDAARLRRAWEATQAHVRALIAPKVA